MSKHSFSLTPLDVFLDMPIKEPEWIWGNRIALGCFTLLIGKPKTGKTLFVHNLIKYVTDGIPLLGCSTKKVSIAYLALEEHQNFLRKSFVEKDIDKNLVHIHIGSLGSELDFVFKELEDNIKMYGTKLIIIDPLAKFTAIDDSNDYNKVYRELSLLSDFARKHNVHILAVHHANKGESKNSDQILGSTGFFGASDGAFFLERKSDSDTATLKSNLRYGDSDSKVEFGYDANKIIISGDVSKTYKVISLESKILNLVASKGAVTIQELITELSMRKEDILSVIECMTFNCQLIKSGNGKKAQPFKYSVPSIDSLGREQHLKGLQNDFN